MEESVGSRQRRYLQQIAGRSLDRSAQGLDGRILKVPADLALQGAIGSSEGEIERLQRLNAFFQQSEVGRELGAGLLTAEQEVVDQCPGLSVEAWVLATIVVGMRGSLRFE